MYVVPNRNREAWWSLSRGTRRAGDSSKPWSRTWFVAFFSFSGPASSWPCIGGSFLFHNLTDFPIGKMEVSWNRGTPKLNHPFSMRFSTTNHLFWGTPIYGNPQMMKNVSIIFHLPSHPGDRWADPRDQCGSRAEVPASWPEWTHRQCAKYGWK